MRYHVVPAYQLWAVVSLDFEAETVAKVGKGRRFGNYIDRAAAVARVRELEGMRFEDISRITASEFIALCGEHEVYPAIASENPAIRASLLDGDTIEQVHKIMAREC